MTDPVPYWPPNAIDVLARDDRTPAHLQHPKDHNDLQVAVNALLLVMGQRPYGQSNTVTAELVRLQTQITDAITGGAGAGEPTDAPTQQDITRLQAEIDALQRDLDSIGSTPVDDPAEAAQLAALQLAVNTLQAQLTDARSDITSVSTGASGTPLGAQIAALQNSVATLQTSSSGTATAGVQRFYGVGAPGVVIGARPSDEYVDTVTGDLYILQ